MRPFLSYAREDKERVRQIAEILIQAGHDPWFDDALLPGQDWKQKLSQAIHECDSFIYILSPESVESEWCQWEFKEAVKQGKPIIPIMLRQTKLPRSLSKFQFVDFTGDTFSAKSVAKLMGGLTEIAVNITAQVSAPESPKGNPPQEQPPNQPTATESNVTRWIGGIVAAIGLILGCPCVVPVWVYSRLPSTNANSYRNSHDCYTCADRYTSNYSNNPNNLITRYKRDFHTFQYSISYH
jgi:hypothetical protein